MVVGGQRGSFDDGQYQGGFIIEGRAGGRCDDCSKH